METKTEKNTQSFDRTKVNVTHIQQVTVEFSHFK